MPLIKLRPYGTKTSSHLVNTDHIITVSAASNDGDTLRCWLWQGACQRLENRTDAW